MPVVRAGLCLFLHVFAIPSFLKISAFPPRITIPRTALINAATPSLFNTFRLHSNDIAVLT